MNYWRCYTGDYLRDTLHLNMIQDGAYRRLLDVYYTTERPLPVENKELYRVARAETQEEQGAVDSVIKFFFKKTVRGFINLRAKREIDRYSELQPKRVSAGKKGGKASASAKAHAQAHSVAFATHPPSPIPQPHIRENQSQIHAQQTTLSGSAVQDDFEIFWESYPRKVAKLDARKAFLQVKPNGHFPELLLGLEAWKRCRQWQDQQHIPYAATFLRRRQWTESAEVQAQESLDAKFARAAAKLTQ